MTPPLLFNGPDGAPLTVALAHGAGAAMDSPFMTTFAEGLGGAGFRVARFEFPYMQRRRAEGTRRPPDRAPVLIETWRAVIAALGGGGGGALIIGGKSMGGRMASTIADDVAARGLVCLGYPFHPPGKAASPERLGHMATLKTPTLIVQGTRDTLGNQDEVGGYALSRAIHIHWSEDGDHSLKPRVASGRTEGRNIAEGVEAVVAFLEQL
jgi:predicted alpha/beta-hydrolase family hydrolase